MTAATISHDLTFCPEPRNPILYLACQGPNCPDLLSAVRAVRPSVLIGISEAAGPIPVTEAVCREMAAANTRPVIMPLSLPSPGAAAEVSSCVPVALACWACRGSY